MLFQVELPMNTTFILSDPWRSQARCPLTEYLLRIEICSQDRGGRGCPDDLAELPYIDGQSGSDSTTASDLSSVVSAGSSGESIVSSKITRVVEQLQSLRVGLSKDNVVPQKKSEPTGTQVVIDSANGLPFVPNPRLVIARILQEAKARRENATTTSDASTVAADQSVPEFVP